MELFGASTEVVAEVREEERIAVPQIPLTPFREVQLRGIRAEQSVAAWLIKSGYQVSPAHRNLRYDYVVEGPEGTFAVSVRYVRSPGKMLMYRLIERHGRAHDIVSEIPLTVVAVAETPETLHEVERLWARHKMPYRLCTGLLTPDGEFQVTRPL